MKGNKKKWIISLFKEKDKDVSGKPVKNDNDPKKDYFLKLFKQ